jgi:ATP-binding cassette, subfamily F, member 3
MLTVHQLSKSYNLQQIFSNVSFSLSPGDRVGLIGPNGCGKTTLVRILSGHEQPDSGHVSHSPSLRIGYLPQGFEPGADLADLTIGELIGQAVGSPQALESELAATAADLVAAPADAALLSRYDELLQRIAYADVLIGTETGRAAAILSGFGFDNRAGFARIDPDLPCRYLSGGQKTRLSLALILLRDPQLLLLDEPTNHLDIEMLEWLESWLSTFPGAALVISHDRTFLDHTVNRILEMAGTESRAHKASLREYAGNYSDFLEQRRIEIEKHWSAYKDQQLEIRRMQQDIARTRDQAATTERQASSIRIGGPDMKIKGFKSYQQGIAKKVAKKAKSRERKLERYLDSEERLERPSASWAMKLEFNQTPSLGRSVISLDDLNVGYNSSAPLLQHLNLEVRSGRRIVLSGANGSGKTTLLRTIAGQLSPISGVVRIGSSVRLGYMTQEQSSLDMSATALDLVQPAFQNQTDARTFLSKFLFTGDEPLKPISQLSYGQRSRLMLAQLVVDGCNCLLLDEPVNHLDIPSRTQFESALGQFEGAVLAVVHDRYFIQRFAQELWWVEDGSIRQRIDYAFAVEENL